MECVSCTDWCAGVQGLGGERSDHDTVARGTGLDILVARLRGADVIITVMDVPLMLHWHARSVQQYCE